MDKRRREQPDADAVRYAEGTAEALPVAPALAGLVGAAFTAVNLPRPPQAVDEVRAAVHCSTG